MTKSQRSPAGRPAPTIRATAPTDRGAVLRLLASSLGWVPDDLFDRFFTWKHEQSPFGRSPAWVAVDGDEVVGFRTFVRWELEHPDGRVRRAVRAVDTATHPDHQGRGIFRRLTEHALHEVRSDGVDLVFNTPNSQSRPGYLKMGWVEVGRPPVAVRPASLGALVRMIRSKLPAERWSVPTSAGHPAAGVLAAPGVAELLASRNAPGGLRTRRSVAYLQWRYGFEPLAYRAVALGGEPDRGLAVFRLRRRGASLEAALCELLVPHGDRRAALSLGRAVARASGADYVIRVGGPTIDLAGYLRVPRVGPVLTWREVAEGAVIGANLGDWDLGLGDIELF